MECYLLQRELEESQNSFQLPKTSQLELQSIERLAYSRSESRWCLFFLLNIFQNCFVLFIKRFRIERNVFNFCKCFNNASFLPPTFGDSSFPKFHKIILWHQYYYLLNQSIKPCYTINLISSKCYVRCL